MKKLLLLLLPVSILCYSCDTNREEEFIEKMKNEILKSELEFAEMAQKEGIPEAFLAYSAEDVVLMRNNTLIIGKEALKESYRNSESGTGEVSLTWKPDFVDVASSGDLGYTYGKYVYTTTDSIGNKNVVEGIFHTVWKKQPDGKWKFVWD